MAEQLEQFRSIEQVVQAMDVHSFEIMAKELNLLIIVLDQDLKLQYGNDLFFALVGWKPEEVLDRDYVQSFIPVEMTFVVRSTLREIIDKKTSSYSGSNQVLTHSRGTRYVNWNSIHLQSRDGQPAGMLCVGLDITEHSSLQNTLNMVNMERRIILENIKEPVVYQDENGRISWVNEAFLDAAGTSRQTTIGSYWYHLFNELGQPNSSLSTDTSMNLASYESSIAVFPDGSEWICRNFDIAPDKMHPSKTMKVMLPARKDIKANSQPAANKEKKDFATILLRNSDYRYQEGIGIFSAVMENVMTQARIIQGDRSVPVLIEGETGTGKEIVARFIHNGNGGLNRPFVDINCAAITPTIFESELFGYEGGAFTGSRPGGQKGKLDMAEGGTLFLDEIGEIPVSIQAKLLRVIQQKEYYRVGGLAKKTTDVRLICATNVNLEQSILEGTFRRDLFYRLEAFRIHIPPLRERMDDIIPLSIMFLRSMSKEKGKKFDSISSGAADFLINYSWPGNVRQLRNVIERVVLMYDDREMKPKHLQFLEPYQIKKEGNERNNTMNLSDEKDFQLPGDKLNLQKLSDRIIIKALELNQGNRTKTAIYLGMSRRSLSYRLQQIALDK